MEHDRLSMELGDSIQEPLGEYPMPWAQGVIPWGNPNDAKSVTFLCSAAYGIVCNHAKTSANREVTGILVGNAYFCPQAEKIYLVIEGAIPATSAAGSRTQVVFDHQSWADVLQIQQRDYPNCRIVGWYHTHPGFGAFFSQDDDFWHKTAFTNSWQVALVLDPLRNQACFFGWSGSRIDHITGFYELLGKGQKASIISRFATRWEFRASLERPPLPQKRGKRQMQSSPVTQPQKKEQDTPVRFTGAQEQTETMATVEAASTGSDSSQLATQEKKQQLIGIGRRRVTWMMAVALAAVLVALALLSAWEPWWIDTHGSRFLLAEGQAAKLSLDDKTGKLSWTSPLSEKVFIWENPTTQLSRGKEHSSYNLVDVNSMKLVPRLQSGLLLTIPISRNARMLKTLYRSNTAWWAAEKGLQSPTVDVWPLGTSQPDRALIFLQGKGNDGKERAFVTITEGYRTHSQENWQELTVEQTEPGYP